MFGMSIMDVINHLDIWWSDI